uniref:Uncharacterized protein n=1 Tax=Anguilla anguilla TaxID=7936 RepID=A0A0E9QKD1_ANGAN
MEVEMQLEEAEKQDFNSPGIS